MKFPWLFLKRYVFTQNSNATIKKITSISFLSITVSVVALVVIMSVMNGFAEAIEKRLLNLQPHITVSLKSSAAHIEELIAVQKKLDPSKEESHLLFEDQVILRTSDGQYAGAISRGLSKTSFERFLSSLHQSSQSKAIHYVTGKRVEERTEEKLENAALLEHDEVVMGWDLAYQLGILEGDEVVLTPPESLLLPQGEIPQTKKVVVREIVRTGVQSLDSSLVLYQRQEEKMFPDALGARTQLEIFLKTPSIVDQVVKRIQTDSLEVETWKTRDAALFYSLAMENKLITLFLILSLVIGCFSIVSILLLMITQKRSEIAMLLTLGLSSKKVSSMFTKMGLIISSGAIFLGLIVGLLICWFLSKNTWIQLPDIYFDRSLPVKFVPGFYLFIVLIAYAVSYLSSFITTRISVQYSPRDLLKKT